MRYLLLIASVVCLIIALCLQLGAWDVDPTTVGAWLIGGLLAFVASHLDYSRFK